MYNSKKTLRHLLILTSLILSIPILQATEDTLERFKKQFKILKSSYYYNNICSPSKKTEKSQDPKDMLERLKNRFKILKSSYYYNNIYSPSKQTTELEYMLARFKKQFEVTEYLYYTIYSISKQTKRPQSLETEEAIFERFKEQFEFLKYCYNAICSTYKKTERLQTTEDMFDWGDIEMLKSCQSSLDSSAYCDLEQTIEDKKILGSCYIFRLFVDPCTKPIKIERFSIGSLPLPWPNLIHLRKKNLFCCQVCNKHCYENGYLYTPSKNFTICSQCELTIIQRHKYKWVPALLSIHGNLPSCLISLILGHIYGDYDKLHYHSTIIKDNQIFLLNKTGNITKDFSKQKQTAITLKKQISLQNSKIQNLEKKLDSKIQNLEKKLNEKKSTIEKLKEQQKNDASLRMKKGNYLKKLYEYTNKSKALRLKNEALKETIKSNEEERDLYYKSLSKKHDEQIKKIDKEHAAKQLIMENKIEKLELKNQQLKTQKTSNQKNFNNNLKTQNKRLQIHHLSNKNKPELEDLLPRLNEENIDNKPQEKSFLKAIASLCVYFSLSFKTKSNNN